MSSILPVEAATRCATEISVRGADVLKAMVASLLAVPPRLLQRADSGHGRRVQPAEPAAFASTSTRGSHGALLHMDPSNVQRLPPAPALARSLAYPDPLLRPPPAPARKRSFRARRVRNPKSPHRLHLETLHRWRDCGQAARQGSHRRPASGLRCHHRASFHVRGRRRRTLLAVRNEGHRPLKGAAIERRSST